MIRIETDSVDATRAVAAAIAGLIKEGDVIYLNGDLGAGKTAFTQGLVAALGFEGRVTSPTFALLQHYEGGDLLVHHVDAYRVTSAAETQDLALHEVLDQRGIMVIEWAERLGATLGADRLEIELLFGEGDDDRVLNVQVTGAAWQARAGLLVEALAPWCVEVEGDA